jgi:hypothetical protein
MVTAFAAAILVVGWPAIATGASVAAASGDDDAAYALGPIAGLALLVLVLEAESSVRLGGLWLSAGPLALGAASSLFLVVRRPTVRWLVAPACAAAGVIAVMAWPFRFVDGPGVLGWNVANDSTVHAVIAQYLVDGRRPPVPGSAFAAALGNYYSGYPSGSHELVAAVAPLAGGVLPAFDATLAIVISLGAFAAYWLIRRCGVGVGLATLGALVAAGGYLQLEYYGEGFLPQMAVTPFVLGGLGLGFEAVRNRQKSTAALLGLVLAASVSTYSAYILLFVGPALVAAVGGALVLHRAHWLAWVRTAVVQTIVAAAVAILSLLPILDRTIDFARNSSSTVENQVTTGNLVGAVDWKIVLGAWVGPDFRVPYVHTHQTQAAMAAAGILAVAGLVGSILRRRPALLLVLAGFAFAALIVSRRSSPYYTAKSYQLLAIPVSCAVVVGASVLAEAFHGWRRAALSAAAAALLAGWALGVTLSLESAVRDLPVTPPFVRELVALRPVVGRRPGVAAIPDDWVKFALPSVAVPFDHATPGDVPAVLPGRGSGQFLDWDSLDAKALMRSEVWVEPNLGGYSVPPPPFRLARTTQTVRVWLRTRAAPAMIDHRPFEPLGVLGGRILDPGRVAVIPPSRAHVVLLGAEAADGVFTRPVTWRLSGTRWVVWSADSRFVVSVASGKAAKHSFVVSNPGTYRVVVIGKGDPGFGVAIDGRRVSGFQRGALSSILPYGEIRLEAGRHVLSLLADAGSVSFIQAVAIGRASPSPPTRVCVGRRRFVVAWNRPVRVHITGSRDVRNCGSSPLRLDWAQAG